MTTRLAKSVIWFVLAIVLMSTANALMRKFLNFSSNALLDIPWNMFGLIFFFCSGYTFLKNEHVRIDVLIGRCSRRTQVWMDIFGILFFLWPVLLLLMKLSWPLFWSTLHSQEVSNSPGGLAIWPPRLTIAIGFSLLFIQSISELGKRVGFLKGLCPDPLEKKNTITPEEALAKAIANTREQSSPL